VDYLLPIVADCEAGFGGPLNAYELTKHMIEAGAAAGEGGQERARWGGWQAVGAAAACCAAHGSPLREVPALLCSASALTSRRPPCPPARPPPHPLPTPCPA
jgi:hypothetical protein